MAERNETLDALDAWHGRMSHAEDLRRSWFTYLFLRLDAAERAAVMLAIEAGLFPMEYQTRKSAEELRRRETAPEREAERLRGLMRAWFARLDSGPFAETAGLVYDALQREIAPAPPAEDDGAFAGACADCGAPDGSPCTMERRPGFRGH